MSGKISEKREIDAENRQRSVMKALIVSALAAISLISPVGAQSLKPDAPAPLQPGINKSTVDNFVGTQYWWFTAEPGECRVHATFRSMGVLGNAARSEVAISLYDASKTWRTQKVLSSDGKAVDCTITGNLKKTTRVLVSVAPPNGGLIRSGGDYELEVTGAVAFGPQSNIDPVVGMYKQMGGYTKMLGDCKFTGDGHVETTSGESGTWKLFDKDSGTYVIDISGQDRHSLQLKPGRGLCDNDSSIVFQQLR